MAAWLLASPGAWAQVDKYQDVTRLLRAGQFEQARQQADQYLASKPRDPQMRFLKGVIQSESGQAPEAMLTFQQLIQDHPELPEPYNNLAVLHAAQGQLDEARAALEMAIRAHPGYATAHENLGDVHARLASRSYRKALQLGAENPATASKLKQLESLLNPARTGS